MSALTRLFQKWACPKSAADPKRAQFVRPANATRGRAPSAKSATFLQRAASLQVPARRAPSASVASPAITSARKKTREKRSGVRVTAAKLQAAPARKGCAARCAATRYRNVPVTPSTSAVNHTSPRTEQENATVPNAKRSARAAFSARDRELFSQPPNPPTST